MGNRCSRFLSGIIKFRLDQTVPVDPAEWLILITEYERFFANSTVVVRLELSS